MRGVAPYTESGVLVQMVCDHPTQIITIQKHITDQQAQQFIPPECDHSMLDLQPEMLTRELKEARSIPGTVGTEQDLRQELTDMTEEARQLGEEVRALRTQLANPLSLAVCATPTNPRQYDDH